MSELFSNLGIEWKIIIAQIVNFAILLFVLSRFLYRPIMNLLEERGAKIGKGLSDAKVNAEMLALTKKEAEETMAKARTEANAIFQSGKKEAEAKKHEMLESAKNDVDALITAGKRSLEAEKQKMVEEAKKEIVNLAMEATKKMLVDNKGVKELDRA